MLDNTSMKTHAENLQGIIKNGSFTDRERKVLAYEAGIQNSLTILQNLRTLKGNLFLVGNGGSSAVVSHILTDYINVARLRARSLHESSLITCMANDFGYENVFSRPLKNLANEQDCLIAISSSGQSLNIINAAETMKSVGGEVITLTGFKPDNPLRSIGDINFWLDSKDYGLVEIGHLFFLHYLSGRLAVNAD